MYEITATIGAGGMGEVYRARDTRLNRDVAIKVLPDLFAGDPDRLARFEREAQTLASLNHPHIAHIHGVIGPAEGGPHGGAAPHALVMELVEGEDLAERVRRGPIPLDEALPIARQVAEALEAAHERGVIHRDLKPANIKLTPDGTVKVLDFGLAKALDVSNAISGVRGTPANSPTFTSPAMTGMGVILGTAAYMSPEQAKGKPVDRRADIWAFGVVLYEMLTGQLLYAGETVTETIAHVITQPAKLDALPAATPAPVRRILRRCLEKDPRSRFQSAGDVRVEIDEFLAAPTADVPAAASPSPSRRLVAWLWPVVAVVAVALGLAISRPWQRSPEPTPSMRLDVRIDESLRLHVDENVDGALAVISPDGQTLVYLGMRDTVRRLYARKLDGSESTALSGTEGALGHFFSPDSKWVAFFAQGSLKKVALSGGAPLTIAPAIDARGGTWGRTDVIVFTPLTTSGLHRVSAAGGTPEPITTLTQRERTHRWPWFLPDGKTVVFISQESDGAYDDGIVEAVNIDTKERKIVLRGGTYPRHLAAGYLTYVRENTLFAVPFDDRAVEVKGTPQPVLSQVMESRGVGAGVGDGSAQVSFSDNGTAVVLSGAAEGTHSQLVITDRTGKQTFALPEKREYRSPRFSPDGTRIAVQVSEASGSQLYIVDPLRSTMTKVTFDGTVNGGPVWSRDGRRLAFFSDGGGPGLNMHLTRSDGGGSKEAITTTPYVTVPTSFSPDGTLLAGMEQGREVTSGMDLVVVSLADKKLTTILSTRAAELLPAFSPDGKWIAYQSDETGLPEVYVRPYPGPGGKWQISSGGGVNPAWTKNGREIVFVSGSMIDQLTAVDVTVAGDTITSGKPQKLFEMPVVHPPNAWWHDVSADGDRFVLLKADSSARSAGLSHVTLITNFFEQVRRATSR